MEILNLLDDKCLKRGLRFIVIGGHAVSMHGYARQTGDLDLMVEKEKVDEWKELLANLGYEMFFEQAAFAQFKPSKVGAWPIDLMLVDQKTFEKTHADAQKADFGSRTHLIPSFQHLIAMKLHALKHSQSARELKDMLDIVQLMKAKNLPLESDDFRQLCEKFATIDVYEKLLAYK